MTKQNKIKLSKQEKINKDIDALNISKLEKKIDIHKILLAACCVILCVSVMLMMALGISSGLSYAVGEVFSPETIKLNQSYLEGCGALCIVSFIGFLIFNWLYSRINEEYEYELSIYNIKYSEEYDNGDF